MLMLLLLLKFVEYASSYQKDMAHNNQVCMNYCTRCLKEPKAKSDGKVVRAHKGGDAYSPRLLKLESEKATSQ